MWKLQRCSLVYCIPRLLEPKKFMYVKLFNRFVYLFVYSFPAPYSFLKFLLRLCQADNFCADSE